MEFPLFAKRNFGVNCIEVLLNHLVAEDKTEFQRLSESASSAGVKIVCLALNNDFTLSGTDLEQECLRTGRILRNAKILGVQIARVNPGMHGEGTAEELAQNVAEGLRRIIPVAKETGIRLALENHDLFGMNPDNILKVIQLVKTHQLVGVCLDFGNFLPDLLDTGPIRLAPYTIYVHAKSYKFDKDGNETKINYLDRIRELKQAGYQGFFSIEWEGNPNEDEIENTQRTIQLINKCFKQLS
jgi:sugar phosphate isomerase/epimerase